ncbi:MAG TPA: aconitase/3-isopropylmalate dehydratase large subunit family protein [Bacteroidales bacterium]|nr:aconitase/3-isopropylmalate dehydratase large subunit family protein [Bacteroidales bacterium]
MKRTFAEKIFNAPSGSIVFARPDIVLTHDNTSSICNTFRKMGGKDVADPDQMLVVLDHNAPPCDSKLATQYQEIRNIVRQQGIKRFYDSGSGICHQLMANHARPGMLVVGSDSHTTTAGAFNSFAAGIDRTEAAGIWKKGETWFRVPESVKITLSGKLAGGVSAKDLALWIAGILGADGASYMSVEFHGELTTLSISDRMTLANMCSEMGAKNAVFPADEVLRAFIRNTSAGIWADEGAQYSREIDIKLGDIFPVVAAPHNVDNIVSLADAAGTEVNEGLIGTCTNGRLEDLRIAAGILKGKNIKEGFQLNIVPASRDIYLRAIEQGIITELLEAGANILSPSCGPCLGTGQGIPADGHVVISTANRNFPGRMGNKNASIYLASPAVVAYSALAGYIDFPIQAEFRKSYPFSRTQSRTSLISNGDNRKYGNIWNYSDVDNLNTDQMFAGKHTYNVQSSDPASVLPFLFEDFDPLFRSNVREGDIIIAGENFGCGSSREHPSVGLAYAGIKAIILKSVNRIFYRSSINQGLPLIVQREAVEAYCEGDVVNIDLGKGEIMIGSKIFSFDPVPEKLRQIIEMKGLVNYMKAV